jgi:hypothetical protein
MKAAPIAPCPIMIGPVACCFSASAKNCIASSRQTSPLNATWFATHKPKRTWNNQRVFGGLP